MVDSSRIEVNRRQLHRELLTAKRDRTRVTNCLQGLLASHGLRVALQGALGKSEVRIR
ncbi:MAG TPA: hypothetical protein VGC99_08210 [Candidatus Tectomicrobia bacterium]